MKHLVFYDGKCGLCDQSVRILLKLDKKQQFVFAPLQGKTAARVLKEVPEDVKKADSVILVENYESPNQKMYLFGKAVFRSLWLIGGFWCLTGWLFFLPAFLYDWGYRFAARNRHHIFRQDICVVPDPRNKASFLE